MELRSILSIIELIDGINIEYNNYTENYLTEDIFLEQQIILTNEIKSRLVDILKI